MKIALCLSGQPRFVREVAPYILQNVCGGYDTDVFMHLWFDQDLQTKPYKYGGNGDWEHQRIPSTAAEDALSIYKPKIHKIEPSKKFKDSTIKTDYSYYPNGPWIALYIPASVDPTPSAVDIGLGDGVIVCWVCPG